jgi:hypothetical protein
MSDPNALPIAGWYPDPENEAGDRWWNGATWSDHRRPRNAPAGWAPTPEKKPTRKAAAAAATAAAGVPAVPAATEPGAVAASGVAADPTAVPVPPVAPAAAERPNPYAGAAQPTYQPAAPGTNPYAPAAPGYAPAAPAYAPYAPAYAPNYAPAQPMRNPAALGGMITSLVALICNFILFGAPGITGAIISFFGLRKANQLIREGVTVGNGRAMAITGIVAGLVGAFLWNLFYFTYWSPLVMS